MKEDGCTKVAIVNDKEVYGAGPRQEHRARRQGAGPDDRLGNDGDRQERGRTTARWPRRPRATGADCFVFSRHHRQQRGPAVQGLRGRAAGREALRPGRRLPSPASSTRRRAASPPTSTRSVKVHGRDAVARTSTRRRARSSSRTTRQKYGDENPDPYAIYGYEAMSLALDAIKRSGDRRRRQDIIEGAVRHQGPPDACSARTRSTRTATRRSPTTASTRSRTAS